MGYTHYWTVKRNIPKATWATITTDVRAIVKHAIENHIGLVVESDSNEAPEITEEHFCFNGAGDAGHETFFVSRVIRAPEYQDDNPKWTFCKTAQKPYDIAVTAILAYLDSIHPGLYVVTSDGDLHEWSPGIALARAALPVYAQTIFAPRSLNKVEA